MAYIIPSDISQLALSNAHTHELNTLDRLKRELPQDYTVFHNIHWSRDYRGGVVFGEIDFIILNRSGDALLIEQKNGRLNETAAGLVKEYNSGPKNVGDQIRRSLENVREKFHFIHGREQRLKLDYLLYCPDHRVKLVNAANLDASRIADASRSNEIASLIQEILPTGKGDDPTWFAKVDQFFRQSFELVTDVHAHVEANERHFTRLTGGLIRVLDNIEMYPMQLRVMGAAGSGKTVLAHHFYDRAVAAGHRPLLVCFNRPLAEKLKGLSDTRKGLIDTWYGLCAKFLESQGHDLDYSRISPEFWNELQDMVVGQDISDDWRFDTIIVDEGQDFEQEWFDILRFFSKEEADFLWFEDADQRIRQTEPISLTGFVGYRDDLNFRSPTSIGNFIQRVLPFRFECANDLPGLGVGVHGYQDPNKQPAIVSSIITELVRGGFSHDDILILTLRGYASSIFAQRERVGNFTLRSFSGEYDLFGNQVLTNGQVRYDSIYRLKGHQAPAVVVVDIDPDQERLDHWQRLLYCAMTRATVRLELVVNTDNQENRVLMDT